MLFFFLVLLFISSLSQATSDLPHPRHAHHSTASSVELARRDRFYGRGTWYIPGLGACGSHASRTDYIVAVNQPQYHGNMCRKHIRVINTKNGRSVDAQVQDKCPGCSHGSLDMSPAVFSAIADSGLGEGELEISWSFSSSYSQSHHPLLHHPHHPPLHHLYHPPLHHLHHPPLHHPHYPPLHHFHYPLLHHCSHSHSHARHRHRHRHSHHHSHSHIHKHKYKHKHFHGPRVPHDRPDYHLTLSSHRPERHVNNHRAICRLRVGTERQVT